jgi:hypothetical protein
MRGNRFFASFRPVPGNGDGMNVGTGTALAGFLALAVIFSSLPLFADTSATGERDRIRCLISHIEGLKDATFVRNGVCYGSGVAAQFLRRKWEANQDKVRTTADFISHVASRSSTTGKPYLIRFKNGQEVECGKYLRDVGEECCRSGGARKPDSQ